MKFSRWTDFQISQGNFLHKFSGEVATGAETEKRPEKNAVSASLVNLLGSIESDIGRQALASVETEGKPSDHLEAKNSASAESKNPKISKNSIDISQLPKSVSLKAALAQQTEAQKSAEISAQNSETADFIASLLSGMETQNLGYKYSPLSV